MIIETIIPEIFPKDEIIAGVTLKNEKLFPDTGLSFSNAKTLTNEQVKLHKQALAEHLNINMKRLKFQNQVHGARIRDINSHSEYEDSDGMITNEKGLFITAKIADCCAVLLYAQRKKVISAIHSGWRGTMQKISVLAVQKLIHDYDVSLDEILVYLSPCASGDKYEVGEDVAKYFPKSCRQISENKYLFDNRNEIYLNLKELGISTSNIEVSQDCTISDSRFHSYRRDKDSSGRMAAYIGLR